MAEQPFALTSIEYAALETIAEERPEVVTVFSEQLALVLDDLALTSQGRVVWGEDEDLRETIVELLLRHLLAEAREGFVRRGVGARRS